MPKIDVEVKKTIRRPLAVVSRQFGDMQHHTRDRVHPDITFTMISEQGDSCRFRRDVKVLGMLQSDEVIQERTSDGALVSDVVTGANVGLRITQSFSPVDADSTVVTLRVVGPATGIKLLLKPLFEIAIRKAVEKGLEEDRVDLEERGYGSS